MRTNTLTAAVITKAAPPKGKSKIRINAGPNLHLLVRRSQDGAVRRYWEMVYTKQGRTRTMGLGSADGPAAVGFRDARDRADELLRSIRNGADPVRDKRAKVVAEKKKAAFEVSFAEALAEYIERHGEDWKNETHRNQWTSSLEQHAASIMRMAVHDIEHDHVFAVLKPIWNSKRETASRVRGRIEAVIDFAEAEGWREPGRINPAQWRGRMAQRLKNKRPEVRHHAALPWADLPQFMRELQQVPGISARCLEFAIFTACRTGEVLGATWAEIDMEARTWRIPKGRMKTNRPHEVPLSDAAVAALEAVRPLRRADDLVFPSPLTTADDDTIGWPLSNMAMLQTVKHLRPEITVHGFRSTFKDWCGEHAVARELAEMSLAHAIGNAVENAYARSLLLERRRPVMQAWADFIRRPAEPAKVVRMKPRG